jgi:hypothetical protein
MQDLSILRNTGSSSWINLEQHAGCSGISTPYYSTNALLHFVERKRILFFTGSRADHLSRTIISRAGDHGGLFGRASHLPFGTPSRLSGPILPMLALFACSCIFYRNKSAA